MEPDLSAEIPKGFEERSSGVLAFRDKVDAKERIADEGKLALLSLFHVWNSSHWDRQRNCKGTLEDQGFASLQR